ncbi:hypothetical protein Dxin01_03394 [Deinococcus xinjiangensis]|uniref:Invasion protein IalB, involved in pathogenesis n=1 Tax=Deinococcus xinjiangensis TaxID=457454 RepID=A0ABP9VGB4_9DEIO
MSKQFLMLAAVVLLMTGSVSAQAPEKGDYSSCDIHVVKSTICGWWHKDGAGGNTSHLTVREENDTGGLTYLSLECMGDGGMLVYVQAKHPLLSQDDFDIEVLPKVTYRVDNGSLKNMEVYPAHEADADGQPVADLNALQLSGQTLQQMANAKKRFQVVIDRNGMSKLTYSFPVYGLEMAIKAVNYCKRM